MKKHSLKLVFMLAFSVCANAQEFESRSLDGVVDYAIPPGNIADSIVTYVPDMDMQLHKMETKERVLEGEVVTIERGVEPTLIIHKAHTMIMPLKEGVPVKLFLKRFPDKDAYYPIAIFPIKSGVKQ